MEAALATRIDTALDQTEAAPAARVCREDGCTTVLSQYNSTAWCGLHSRRDWRANREPRRRSAPAGAPASETGADGAGEDEDW
jgi:hypothetical protein